MWLFMTGIAAALLCAACWSEQRDVADTQELSATAVISTSEPTATAVSVLLPTAAPTDETAPAPTETPPAVQIATPDPVNTNSDPPVRDLFDLAQRYGRIDAGGEPPARTLPPSDECCEVGQLEQFFVADLVERHIYMVEARLIAVSENAYWYVDEELELETEELELAADVFEREIRLPIVEAIGDIWKPGVDGDARLTVLHTPLKAAAGYFSASDSYPRAAHPHSNEREMIVMDGVWLRPGSREYLSVLAHEFQHAVHWNLDLGEDAWLNEGMSEVAVEIAGFNAFFADSFLLNPEVQLNFWPDEPRDTLAHYGGVSLFVEYLAQHYGGYAGLSDLAREPLDGVNGVERYLSQYGKGFEDVFADWVVANYLDGRLDGVGGSDDGRLDGYKYAGRSVMTRKARQVNGDFAETVTQPQLSARYYELRLPEGDALVEFGGSAMVQQVDTVCGSGRFCWWGGNGDMVDTTLEREFDLSGVDEATLEFWMWYEIEEDWDYAYVSVSVDEGKSWATLDGRYTTRENPLGANYGAGITGISGGWVQERMDLSPYAGVGSESVLVRFEYITDDAVNLGGILIDDISIPELGFADDAEGRDGWRANGFRRTDNMLRQDFALRLIEFGKDGGVSVRAVEGGSFRVDGFGERLDYAVLVVAPMTHATYRPAEYSLNVRAQP